MAKHNKKLTQLLNKIKKLVSRSRFSDAASLCTQALELDPDNFDALLLHGRILYNLRDLDEAAQQLEKASQIDSNDQNVRLLLYATYQDQYNFSQLVKLADTFKHSPLNDDEQVMAYLIYLRVCDWVTAEKLESNAVNLVKSGKINQGLLPNFLLSVLGCPNVSPELMQQLHLQWSKAYPKQNKKQVKKIAGRVRVAYLSGDFRNHPIAYFTQQVIAMHNREEFEVFCYAQQAGHFDELTQKFQSDTEHFIDTTAMDDQTLINHMKKNDIHIAIDLAGHTTLNRLPAFAQRLAPVQISYLGYPNSTGIKEMDFHITDHFAQDLEHGTQYSENLLFMPESFLCYAAEWTHEKKSTPPCKEKGYVSFASFNNSSKINLEVIETWSKILHQVEHSRLLLKFIGSHIPIIKNNVLKSFNLHGIDESRIEFVIRTPNPGDHMLAYHDVDITLDPFPYTGTTTTCEALSQGVPIITLVGPHHANRVSYSILKNIGYEDTITYSKKEYIEKAVNLANNPNGLTVLRGCLPLLLQHSPLRQTEKFVHNIENLYKEACEKKGISLKFFSTTQKNKDNEQENITPPQSTSHDDETKQPDSPPPERIAMSIEGNIQIVVPNNLNLMTPYVLSEQHDWFEDEIKFIRKLIKPGMKVLDIGANYGCYALTIANLIGNKGHLWAFEPASSTASFLAESISTNGFKNISLIKAALSNCKGTAELSIGANSELNSISVKNSSGMTESVPLMQLDDCIKSCQWHGIEFVKLDAEGEEIHILEGGQAFFSQFSPLVMYELKHGDQVNEGLIEKFKSMGYQSYSLIPGLQLLAPFNHEDTPDGYLLNLFCCKEGTALSLANDGFLIQKTADEPNQVNSEWLHMLSKHPYASKLISKWKSHSENNNSHPGWEIYELALNHYASAYLNDTPAAKLSHLQQSFIYLVSLLDQNVTIPRAMTLIRVATELGHRSVAVQILNQITPHLKQENRFDSAEPFLAVSLTAENTDPNGRLFDWCLASVLAAKVKLHAFSTYFTGEASLSDIELFLQEGYPDDAILRRSKLIRQRFQTPNLDQIPLKVE